MSTCKICGKSFNGEDFFNVHMALTHRHFTCELCRKTFKHRDFFAIHMFRQHFVRVPSPERSNVTIARQKKNLSKMSKEAREKYERKSQFLFSCMICKTEFSDDDEMLKNHMMCHADANHLWCLSCTRKFDNLENLKEHMVIHSRLKTRSEDDERRQCHNCNKVIGSARAFTIHKRYCEDKRSYQCDVCGKAFHELSSLKQHKMIHTGEKPFKCDYCSETFRYRIQRKRHMLKHIDNTKFYICDKCGKQFKDTNRLNNHIKLHTGETPYKCKTCSKQFHTHAAHRQHSQRSNCKTSSCKDNSSIADSYVDLGNEAEKDFDVEENSLTFKITGSNVVKVIGRNSHQQSETLLQPGVSRLNELTEEIVSTSGEASDDVGFCNGDNRVMEFQSVCGNKIGAANYELAGVNHALNEINYRMAAMHQGYNVGSKANEMNYGVMPIQPAHCNNKANDANHRMTGIYTYY